MSEDMQEDYLNNFTKYLYNKKYSDATINNYIYGIKDFYIFLDKDKTALNKFTAKKIEEFKNYLVSKNSSQTINTKLFAVKKFTEYLYETKNIKIEYQVKIVKNNNKKSFNKININSFLQFLSKENLNNTLICDRNKLLFKITYYTGASISDLLNLKKKNVKKSSIDLEGKIIKLDNELHEEIGKYLEVVNIRDAQYLFFSYAGRKYNFDSPLTIRAVQDLFKKYTKFIGNSFSLNDLKNSHLANINNNILEIKMIFSSRETEGRKSYLELKI